MDKSRKKPLTERFFNPLYLITAVMIVLSIWAGPGSSFFRAGNVRAKSVSYKSPYSITTKISKKTLKKGEKAKVTVTVKNTTGAKMNSLKLKAVLPGTLKKSGGTLTKNKSTLGANKKVSFSFKVKAKEKVTFNNSGKSKRTKVGLTTMITAKNSVKNGKKKNWLSVNMSCTRPASAIVNPDSFADSMIDLLNDMSIYAKRIRPDFAMVTNGGYGLYMSRFNKNETSRQKLIAAMDGVLIEDVFYGWNNKMNRSMTSTKESRTTSANMQTALKEAKTNGLSIFNMEYCKGASASDSDRKSKALGSVWYNAPSYDLNKIPSLSASRENRSSVTKLSQVKNFMALLDQEKFSTKKKYLEALKNTDYDLIFIDMYYGDEKLTSAEVTSLKKKKNGARRMVCAYVSVGEAEKYRYYWDKEWNKKLPVWIDSENKDWDGNYKVKYWSRDWQEILYGTPASYLGQVLNAGFDGAYLDVIDAYEYFEKKNK